MRDLRIETNDSKQRLDRFMRKYLSKAPVSLINKYIRTKKIKVNRKRALPDTVLEEGDIVNLFIYDEVLESYREPERVRSKRADWPEILYEDDHILLIYKPVGILTHPASQADYGKTAQDMVLAYLIGTGSYVPRLEKSFVPALANRIDRNTSGMLVACKTHEALTQVNRAMRTREIQRAYRTIVHGAFKERRVIDSALVKDEEKNRMHTSYTGEGQEAKSIVTPIHVAARYSLVEVELITGRTHQIRAHLASIGHPIIGDPKYGSAAKDGKISRAFEQIHQYLIAYYLRFDGLENELSHLNGKSFTLPQKYYAIALETELMGGIYERTDR